MRPLLGVPGRAAGRPSEAPSTRRRSRRSPRLLRGQVHVLEPRKMWPGGAFGSRGRIPAGEAAEVGRTLVFADAPEWRETVAAMFARDAAGPGAGDGRLRAAARAVADLVAGAARAGGRPCRRPGFGLLTRSVVDHLAAVGRLDAAMVESGSPPADLRELSSAEEAAFWRDRLDPVRLAEHPGPSIRPAGRCCWWWTRPRRCGRSRSPRRCCDGPAPPSYSRCCCTGAPEPARRPTSCGGLIAPNLRSGDKTARVLEHFTRDSRGFARLCPKA